jgi:hypothetical protein
VSGVIEHRLARRRFDSQATGAHNTPRGVGEDG